VTDVRGCGLSRRCGLRCSAEVAMMHATDFGISMILPASGSSTRQRSGASLSSAKCVQPGGNRRGSGSGFGVGIVRRARERG
jgi:hypothetical protein